MSFPYTQSYPIVFSPFQGSYPPAPNTFIQSSIPWWQASYVNHGNQTLQQFLSPECSVPRQFPNTSQMIFHIRFLCGNISICYGCHNKYSKKPPPPINLCLQTEEWREYTPQGGHSAVPQTRSRWANTYYHLNVTCVCLRWPSFDPTTQVVIEDHIRPQLLESHKDLALHQLGLRI